MTDPIADMLTRVRNALAVAKESVSIPFSRLKNEIARVLKDEGYIHDFSVVQEGGFQYIKIDLKYVGRTSVIQTLKRVSKPGCRIYSKMEDIPVVLNNVGISIISTSHGVMTNKMARKSHLGGEILCEIS